MQGKQFLAFADIFRAHFGSWQKWNVLWSNSVRLRLPEVFTRNNTEILLSPFHLQLDLNSLLDIPWKKKGIVGLNADTLSWRLRQWFITYLVIRVIDQYDDFFWFQRNYQFKIRLYWSKVVLVWKISKKERGLYLGDRVDSNSNFYKFMPLSWIICYIQKTKCILSRKLWTAKKIIEFPYNNLSSYTIKLIDIHTCILKNGIKLSHGSDTHILLCTDALGIFWAIEHFRKPVCILTIIQVHTYWDFLECWPTTADVVDLTKILISFAWHFCHCCNSAIIFQSFEFEFSNAFIFETRRYETH